MKYQCSAFLCGVVHVTNTTYTYYLMWNVFFGGAGRFSRAVSVGVYDVTLRLGSTGSFELGAVHEGE